MGGGGAKRNILRIAENCRERISHVLIAYQRSLRISASGGGGGSRTGNRDEEEEEEKEEECFRDFLSVEVGGNDA